MNNMIRFFLTTFVMLAISTAGYAQGGKIAYPGGKQYLVRVMLTDKRGTTYSLYAPEQYLSWRSLERRRRQGIAVDSTDLPISPIYIDSLRGRGMDIVCMSKWNNCVLVKTESQDARDMLERLPFVKEAMTVFSSPDSIRLTEREDVKDSLGIAKSPDYGVYGVAEEQIKLFNGVPLHEAGFRGRGILIGILDGGFMNADKIPAFKNIDVVGVKDFGTPHTDDIYAEASHGTMVLSMMAMNMPNMFVGTAPDARYLLVRSEVSATESLAEEDYWAAAVEYADSVGVDLINSSLGYNTFDDKSTNHRYRDLDGRTALNSRSASMLARKGIILVNSAGNSGNNTWKKIGTPADASDILAVGALTKNKVNTVFSSVGPSADGRVKPDVMAMGSACSVVDGDGTLAKKNGTSFASPLTCGMVACLWQALPGKTALEIIDLVRRSAHQYETPDNIFGYGIPDFWKAYGMGKAQE